MLQIIYIALSCFITFNAGAAEARTKQIKDLLNRKALVNKALESQSKLSPKELGDLIEEDLLLEEVNEQMLTPQRCENLVSQVRFVAHPTSSNDEDLSPVAKNVIQKVTAVCNLK